MYKMVRTISNEGNHLYFPRLRTNQSCDCSFPTYLQSEAKIESLTTPSDNSDGDGIPLRKPVRDRLEIKPDSTPLPRKNGEIKMTPILLKDNRTTFYPFSSTDERIVVGSERRQGWTQSGSTCLRAGVPWYRDTIVYTYDEARWETYNGKIFDLQRKDLTKDINRVIGNTIEKTTHTWDALTDLAELRSTLVLAAKLLSRGAFAIRKFKNLLEHISTPGNVRQVLASEWLQFQYGIMPVIYSLQDISKMLEEREAKYATGRSKTVVVDRRSTRDVAIKGTDATERCLYTVHDLTHTIRGTGKVMYSSTTERLIDRLGFNPLRTAWDLTRFSMVVDWFFDVSAMLTAFGARLSLNSSAKFCYSVKTTGSITRYAFRPGNQVPIMAPRTNGVVDFFCQPVKQSYIPLNRELLSGREELDAVSSITEVREYQRVLFSPSDYKLMFDPQLQSFRRQLSALALAIVTFKI